MIYSRKELIYEKEMGLPVEIAGEGQIVYIQYINGHRTKISITDILDTGLVVYNINEDETILVDYDEIYSFELI